MTDVNLPPAAPPAAQTPRGIKIALAVSVAINLAVVGLIGGLALHDGSGWHGDKRGRDMGFGPFDTVFSPEDRTALRDKVALRVGDFKASRRQLQGDMTTILTALRAEPYDGAAVKTAFDAQAGHLTSRLTLGNAVIRDYVLSLSPVARLAFAGRLDQVLQHGPDGDGRSDGRIGGTPGN